MGAPFLPALALSCGVHPVGFKPLNGGRGAKLPGTVGGQEGARAEVVVGFLPVPTAPLYGQTQELHPCRVSLESSPKGVAAPLGLTALWVIGGPRNAARSQGLRRKSISHACSVDMWAWPLVDPKALGCRLPHPWSLTLHGFERRRLSVSSLVWHTWTSRSSVSLDIPPVPLWLMHS